MSVLASKLTVLFEDPFWIGIYEREYDGKYEVSKITFGAEPKDYEVFEFMLNNIYKLKFSNSIKAEKTEERRINPKRMQRLVNNQTADKGIGTKAQQALKLQQEQGKIERKVKTRQEREEEKQRKFELHKLKQKRKHRDS